MENTFPIQIALINWDRQNQLLFRQLAELSDEQLMQEIAPGKNTGRYLLGHLVAVHDYLFPLLGLGERIFPEIEKHYIRTPDNPSTEQPSVADLRGKYKEVLDKLNEAYAKLTDEDWLGPHTRVSEEDFAKEPHRNKLNVLMGRTNHLAYHLGQLILLKGK